MQSAIALVDTFERALSVVDELALHAGAWLVVAIALLVASDVVGRSLFAHSISGTVELARNAVVVIVFCQVPASIIEGKMLRVLAIYSKLSGMWQLIVESFAALIAIGIFAILITSAVDPMISAFRSEEFDGIGALKVPMGPFRAALIFLWVLALLSALLVLAKCVLHRTAPLVAVTE